MVIEHNKAVEERRLVRKTDMLFTVYARTWREVYKANREKLFCTRDGGWVTKSNYRKMWSRITAELQAASDEPIARLTAHVFRHNYRTNLCYQIPAVSIGKVAELLGDTEKMVLEVYSHIITEKEDAAGAVESALDF